MIIVIARVRAHPGKRDELTSLLAEVQTESRKDEGCLAYGYYESITEDNHFVAVEEWRDRAALDVHLRTGHVGRLVARLGDVLAAPPEIAIHEVASSGPMSAPASHP